MNMTKMAYTLCTSMVLSFSGTALATHNSSFIDEAKVTRVEAIYRTVEVAEPREVCHRERVRSSNHVDHSSATPMILGGILGGVVGNQFGRGNGKDFMTIAGTVLGGSVGRDIGHRNAHRGGSSRMVTQCETVNDYHTEEIPDGYRVTYRYKGERFTTRMPYDPGNFIKVRVAVKPIK